MRTSARLRKIDLNVEESAIDLYLTGARRRPHDLVIDGSAATEIEPRPAARHQLEHRSCAAAHVGAAGLVRHVRKVRGRSRHGRLREQCDDGAGAQQRTTTTWRTRAESVLLRQTVHSAPFAPTGDAHRPFRRLKARAEQGIG
jgi:hypothetical protein